MDLTELLNEREWRKCRGPEEATVEERLEAFLHFAENYWYIKHPERGRILFELREAQVDTVRLWMQHRYTIVLKARQIGFSTLAAAYAFWLVYFFSDRYVVMLSRTEREAAKLLAKAKYGAKLLPLWMKQRGPNQTSDNQLKMTFANESAIESLPSGNDPARGESVYLVIVDEMAFLPNPDEAWASIEPIADVGGRVITLSTANGSGNWFHSTWLGATAGINAFHPIFWPWSAGDRDADWYEAKARNMPSWQLHQEYPRNPDEAFIKSGNPVFDIDTLRSLPTEEPERGTLWVTSKKNPEFRKGENGALAIWQYPQIGSTYVVGADVSEGLGHGDFSAAFVIDARTSAVVASYHAHIDVDKFGELLAEIGWWYNTALVGVESNNHGLTTIKAMQRYGYRNLYRQRRLGQRVPEATEAMGWRTTQSSKPLAIDELNAGIRDRTLQLPCAHTIAELTQFVRDENGKMHGSPHDDRVMALAITWQMLKYVWLPEFRAEAPIPRYSAAWFEKFAVSEDLPFKRVPIGAFNVRNP